MDHAGSSLNLRHSGSSILGVWKPNVVRETLFSARLDLGTQTGGSDETKKVQRRRHTVEKLSQVGYTQLDGVTHAKAWNLGLLRST